MRPLRKVGRRQYQIMSSFYQVIINKHNNNNLTTSCCNHSIPNNSNLSTQATTTIFYRPTTTREFHNPFTKAHKKRAILHKTLLSQTYTNPSCNRLKRVANFTLYRAIRTTTIISQLTNLTATFPIDRQPHRSQASHQACMRQHRTRTIRLYSHHLSC